MKKIMVILVGLFLVVSSGGCALQKNGVKNPMQIKPSTPNNTLQVEKLDTLLKQSERQTAILEKIAITLSSQPQQARPRPEELKPVKEEKAQKQEKKKKIACVTRKEFNNLKNRVGWLEDILADKGANSVYFPSASSYLSDVSKAWLEKNIIKRWFNGEIDITGINGYASKAKPKNPITNLDYARQRVIAVQNYLKSRGVQLSGVKIKVVGPTERFGNNLNVTIVWHEIFDEQKQKQKKEERKQYKIDP